MWHDTFQNYLIKLLMSNEYYGIGQAKVLILNSCGTSYTLITPIN